MVNKYLNYNMLEMSLSCPSQTSLTDNELNQTFGDGVIQGLLPISAPSSADRDGSGLLTKTAIDGIVSSLKSSGVIPQPKSADGGELYLKKQTDLLKNVQAEYCFYDARYKYSLNKLFTAINNGYINNTPDTQAVIQKYLTSTQALNRRLNDLTQITNAVTEYMLSSTSDLEQEIRSFEKQITELQGKLLEQNKLISSNQAVSELNKQMVKFTEQKAKYSNNLLGLYSFLNVVALGLLVYVYKSASN